MTENLRTASGLTRRDGGTISNTAKPAAGVRMILQSLAVAESRQNASLEISKPRDFEFFTQSPGDADRVGDG